MPRYSWLAAAVAVVVTAATGQAQTPPQTYQDQLNQYQQQQQQYQDQRQNYDARRDEYQDRLDQYEYDRAHPAWWWRDAWVHATPQWYVDFHGGDLAGMEVDERDGGHVGHVMGLEPGPDGRIEHVRILLHHDRVTWVDADDVRFDRGDNIVFVDVSRDQLYADSRDRYEHGL